MSDPSHPYPGLPQGNFCQHRIVSFTGKLTVKMKFIHVDMIRFYIFLFTHIRTKVRAGLMKIKTNEIVRKYGTPMNFEYDPRSTKTIDYALRL